MANTSLIVLFSFQMSHVININLQTALLDLSETNPAGSSINQGIHFLQSHNTNRFRQYDWGFLKNMQRYGSFTPPDYELSNIAASTFFYSSEKDIFCCPADVETLLEQMPRVFEMHTVPDKSFTHLDFIVGSNVKELINDYILQRMNNYEGNQNLF